MQCCVFIFCCDCCCCCCYIVVVVVVVINGTLATEFVEKMITLNKTDILLAKKRFQNMQKEAFKPLTSRDSFRALPEQEQRVRKAQQFGVQLMPGLGKMMMPGQATSSRISSST